MLLLFVSGGIVFVIFTQSRQEPEDPGEGEVTSVIDNGKAKLTSTPFRIEGAKLSQEGDAAWLLELSVRYKNQTEGDVSLQTPQATLVTESGAEVPEFFLAFSKPPVISPETEELVQLRYWLQPQHRESDLWLQIMGDRTKVEVAETPPSTSTVPSS